MIQGILQLLIELMTGLLQAFGFRNYNTWSNASSASSRQRWSEERQPLQQEQQRQPEQEEV
jgi:hypothetical protein